MPINMLKLTFICSAVIKRRAGTFAAAGVVCWRGGQSDGNEEGPGESTPRRKIWFVSLVTWGQDSHANDAVVDIADSVDVSKLIVGKRVTLLSDSYKLEKTLPSSVDPLVSLMMVEKVPDSTYDMI